MTTPTVVGWWAPVSSGLLHPIGRPRSSIIILAWTIGHLLFLLGHHSSSVTLLPGATAATAPATAGVCFECEKRHDDEQHRGNASAGSHGTAELAPHRRGRLSLRILPRTKSFQ